MKFLYLLVFIFSCSSIEPVKKIERISVSKTILLMPGKVNFESFKTSLENGRYELKCEERSIPFLVKAGKGRVYFIESYFSKMKSEKCNYKDISFRLEKKEFPYKKERLNVDKRRVFLNKKDLARVIKEREIKKEIYSQSQNFFIFEKAFRAPLKSYITSHYGNKRLFNNKKQTQHLGNDLRAAIGVKIPVMNKGRVVYTGNLFYSGNIVVVDHGLEIFSIYGHLSKILVSKGDIINIGDIVGLAGATGRVSGPHLHWGVRIQGQWVDGFSLVASSKKQFNE